MKKRILPGLLAALCLLAALVLPASAAGELTGVKGFDKGVSMHNKGWAAYREDTLEQQMKLAADLGITLVRFDSMWGTINGVEWTDRFVETAEAYGLDMMMIVYVEDTESAQAIASRYKGKIKYYQVHNEVDCATIIDAGHSGESLSDYDPVKLKTKTDAIKACIKGLRAADPAAEIVINSTFVHYGFTEYLVDQGVDFDVIGWDWYSQQEEWCHQNRGYDITGLLDILREKFPDKDIIFCELNILADYENGTDTRQGAFIEEMAVKIYEYAKKDPAIRGLVIYELLDEPDKGNQEGHFGLVYLNDDFSIRGPKPAYRVVQDLFGGDGKATSQPKGTTAGTTAEATARPTTAKPTAAPTTSRAATTTGSTVLSTAQATVSTAQSTTATQGTETQAVASPTVPSDGEGGLPIWPFIVAGIVILLGGGGAALYFLVIRPKIAEKAGVNKP